VVPERYEIPDRSAALRKPEQAPMSIRKVEGCVSVVVVLSAPLSFTETHPD
jgi:hypothetical protein